MLKGKLQSELFYCNHLGVSENDERDIMNFVIRDEKGAGLLQYIQHYAFPDEDEGTMRTYMVRDNRSNELVGYFSLKAGLYSYNEHSNNQKRAGRVFSPHRLIFQNLHHTVGL